MKIKVAITGYGRIGRNTLRAIYEQGLNDQIEVVAINAMGSLEVNAHLTQYDSVHGRFPGTVTTIDDNIIINGDCIPIFSDRNPLNLPWGELGVDIVFECTGAFNSSTKCQVHLEAGAKKVLISAPAKEVDKTIVMGVNEEVLSTTDKIISNASCTTNCLAPLAKVMNDNLGINNGLMVTIHAYTNDQVLTDVYHSDLRRARSATSSIIPTKTGAASGVALVIPSLKGKMDGYAVRVPTTNVSMVILTFNANRNTDTEEVNGFMEKATDNKIIDYIKLPLVSCDFNHHPVSCVFDPSLTRVQGNLISVSAYYDNEWAYSCRMLDVALAIAKTQ